MPDESTDVLVYPVGSAAPPDLQKQLSDMAKEMARQLAMIRELQDTKADEGGELDTGFAQPGLDVIVTAEKDVSAWRYEWLSSTSVKVYEGALALDGLGVYETDEANVSLTGATAYVYATLDKVTKAAAVSPSTSATYPVGNASEYRKALYKFTSSDSGVTYQIARCCRGDVLMGSPA